MYKCCVYLYKRYLICWNEMWKIQNITLWKCFDCAVQCRFHVKTAQSFCCNLFAFLSDWDWIGRTTTFVIPRTYRSNSTRQTSHPFTVTCLACHTCWNVPHTALAMTLSSTTGKHPPHPSTYVAPPQPVHSGIVGGEGLMVTLTVRIIPKCLQFIFVQFSPIYCSLTGLGCH